MLNKDSEYNDEVIFNCDYKFIFEAFALSYVAINLIGEK
jgi:hypothetical protein